MFQSRMIKTFLTALQFLTIIPVRGKDEYLGKSILFFPAAGLFLGLVLAGVNIILSPFFQPLTVWIIMIVLLVLLTGAIHLDGVADTFDALAGSMSREERLKIMRDSSTGAIGAAAVCCILLLKLGGFSSIPSEFFGKAVILMLVLSRWSLVGGCSFFSYAQREGKALVFMKNRSANIKYFLMATIFTFLISTLCFGWRGIIVFILTGMTGFLLIKFLDRKFGGISGDTLGMLNESIEVISLLFIGLLI